MMKIKQTSRVRYEVNPLIEVVAQLRFSPIFGLEKESKSLSSVQSQLDEIGFSVLKLENLASITVTLNAPQESNMANLSQSSQNTPIYHFSTKDNLDTFSVCRDFVALTARSYSDWPDFSKKLNKLCNIFEANFKPIYISRVGLRYKDLIEKNSLNLNNYSWSELLQPVVSGFLSTKGFVESVEESCVLQQSSQTVLKLNDCELLLQSALLRAADNPKQQAFLIDSDFYVNPEPPLALASALELINSIHHSANSVFQNCIKEPLHVALRPIPN